MNLDDMYCVEYSVSQQCFHIDTLQQIVIQNKITVEQGTSTDYKIVAVCSSYDNAKAMAAYLDVLYKKAEVKQGGIKELQKL